MLGVEVVNSSTTLGLLGNIASSLANARRIADSPEVMSAAVSPIGDAWGDNFRSQGARVGGWKALSPYTQRERELRGYSGSSPILKQEGGLFRHAIAPFGFWRVGQTQHTGTIPPTMARSADIEDSWRMAGPGDAGRLYSYGETRVVARVGPRSFFANISGPKAQHQYGGPIPFANRSGWTHLPARPFWFFDGQALDAALVPVSRVFMSRLFERMPNPVRPSISTHHSATYGV